MISHRLSLFAGIFKTKSQWQCYSTLTKPAATVFGIETSCDDTACAVVNSNREILGEASHSQLLFHIRNGGIHAGFAHEMHRENIERVANEALANAKISIEDVDAIAVTNRPGLDKSLKVGLRYAKHLARKYQKPLIPVNHMEAHALAARLEHSFGYPFLCLLASGGHCQLLMVRDVDDFCLLGETVNKPPGAMLDRIARTLNLRTIPEYETFSGGRAIEMAAYKSTNANRFSFPPPLVHERDCDFGFCNFLESAKQKASDLRRNTNRDGYQIIPYHQDFCAGLLKGITNHILQRTQRAMRYCERISLFGFGPTERDRTLVFSGGVACNQFIFKALTELGKEFGYQCYKPSNRLCSDNGVMIAWAGIERWLHNSDKYRTLDIDSVSVNITHGFNTDHVELLKKKKLKDSWIKVPCMQRDVVSLDD